MFKKFRREIHEPHIAADLFANNLAQRHGEYAKSVNGKRWSRRITEEHRLVYTVTGGTIQVVSCNYHYVKK